MADGETHQSNTSSQTQTSSIDPRYQQIQLDNLTKAQGVAGQMGQAYTGPLSADFSGTTLPQAISGYQSLSGYQAPTLAGTNLQPYENPYTSDVINTTLAQLSRQNNVDNTNAAGQATAAHAFGGSRSAVLQNLNTDSYQRNAAQTVAGLNQANFTQAQGAASQDIANNLASANIRGNAASGLTGIAGMQQTQSQDALSRAYNAWLAQQQGALTGQQLLNSTVYGLSAPTTTTGQGTSDMTQTQTPGLGQILGGFGSLAMGIGTGGLGFAPFAAGAGAGAGASGAGSMFSGGLSSNYFAPLGA